MARSDGGRGAPQGWCESLRCRYGFGSVSAVGTTPALASFPGFPSLSKEGSLRAQFRTRNQLAL